MGLKRITENFTCSKGTGETVVISKNYSLGFVGEKGGGVLDTLFFHLLWK